MPNRFISPENNFRKLMISSKHSKWPWDIWYRSGNWLGPSLNPISSAIKLGSFLLCLPSHHPLDCQSGGDRERWSFFFSKNSILAFWLMMNSCRNGMRILVKLLVPKPTNDFVTLEIDDHAHRMLKHLITKHLQVWTNTNENLSHRPKQSKFHYLSQPNFSDKMT